MINDKYLVSYARTLYILNTQICLKLRQKLSLISFTQVKKQVI